MKKLMLSLIGVVAFAGMALADSYTYTYAGTANATNTSDAIPISGYLDKIELSGPGATATNAVTIATYDGTTAVDTLVTKSVTTPVVVRLRVQPTDNTGTVIAAVATEGAATNVTRVLSVPYEKVLVGGNIKVVSANAHANAASLKVVFYYEPLKK